MNSLRNVTSNAHTYDEALEKERACIAMGLFFISHRTGKLLMHMLTPLRHASTPGR